MRYRRACQCTRRPWSYGLVLRFQGRSRARGITCCLGAGLRGLPMHRHSSLPQLPNGIRQGLHAAPPLAHAPHVRQLGAGLPDQGSQDGVGPDFEDHCVLGDLPGGPCEEHRFPIAVNLQCVRCENLRWPTMLLFEDYSLQPSRLGSLTCTWQSTGRQQGRGSAIDFSVVSIQDGLCHAVHAHRGACTPGTLQSTKLHEERCSRVHRLPRSSLLVSPLVQA